MRIRLICLVVLACLLPCLAIPYAQEPASDTAEAPSASAETSPTTAEAIPATAEAPPPRSREEAEAQLLAGTDWGELPRISDLRRRIRNHQGWVDYYRESKDYRVFFLLASRAGRVVDMNRAKVISAALLKHPERTDAVLANWGIDADIAAYNERVVTEWEKRYGADAIVNRTRNYIFLGTKNNEVFLGHLVYYQQRIFNFYERKFKVQEQAEPFLVILHPSQDAYVQAGGPAWSAAYYSGSERAMVGFVPREFSNNAAWQAQNLIKTFFHEGWHLFFHYHVPNPPIWLDEGLAQIAETTVVRRNQISEGEQGAMHVTRDFVLRAQAMVNSGQYVPLERMIHQTVQEFQANPGVSYPQSYSFVHFLLHGHRRYRRILDRLIDELMDCKGREEAIRIAFDGFDLKEMEAEWIKHVGTMKPFDTPSTFR